VGRSEPNPRFPHAPSIFGGATPRAPSPFSYLAPRISHCPATGSYRRLPLPSSRYQNINDMHKICIKTHASNSSKHRGVRILSAGTLATPSIQALASAYLRRMVANLCGSLRLTLRWKPPPQQKALHYAKQYRQTICRNSNSNKINKLSSLISIIVCRLILTVEFAGIEGDTMADE